jgi:hypothetical protein
LVANSSSVQSKIGARARSRDAVEERCDCICLWNYSTHLNASTITKGSKQFTSDGSHLLVKSSWNFRGSKARRS